VSGTASYIEAVFVCGLSGLRADWFLDSRGISVAAGAAAGGFALTASHLFQTPECRPSKKVTQKALPRRTARSLKLGVPSLRDRSGRSGYGLLRCTSFRCVRLRRTVAALPHPDRSRNETCRRGKRSRAGSKATAKAKARSKDRSLRQLQLDCVLAQDQVGCQAAFASKLAPTESKAAQLPAAKPHHSTMSASSSAFDLRATSEG
jgi:hypothetical protein